MKTNITVVKRFNLQFLSINITQKGQWGIFELNEINIIKWIRNWKFKLKLKQLFNMEEGSIIHIGETKKKNDCPVWNLL